MVQQITPLVGIDVSKWQGAIDWQAVKNSGISFAMLRAGFGQGNVDAQFERNASECERLGIPFGVYWFSYAYNIERAKREAEYCLEAVEPYKLSYPIAFDFEYDSVDFAKENHVTIDKKLASSIARAFLDDVEAAGYHTMLYANPNYLSQYFDEDIPKEYDIWLAQWPGNAKPENKPAQAGGMWQYTSSGTVPGISGRVDMNFAYVDYPAIIGGATIEPVEDYEAEVAAARDYVMREGISDGERPDDPLLRKEFWVMLYRMNKEGK